MKGNDREEKMRGGGGGGYYWEFLVGVCRPVLQNPDPISDQEMSFFHTRFQTWPLRNYVIIT